MLRKTVPEVANVNQRRQQEIEMTRMHLQLCYLQLSQALPVAFNNVMFAIDRENYAQFSSASRPGYKSVTSGLTLTQAMDNLSLGYCVQYSFLLTVISNDIAHCLHFYLYFIFTRSFRQEAMKRLRFAR